MPSPNYVRPTTSRRCVSHVRCVYKVRACVRTFVYVLTQHHQHTDDGCDRCVRRFAPYYITYRHILAAAAAAAECQSSCDTVRPTTVYQILCARISCVAMRSALCSELFEFVVLVGVIWCTELCCSWRRQRKTADYSTAMLLFWTRNRVHRKPQCIWYMFPSIGNSFLYRTWTFSEFGGFESDKWSI